MAARLLPQPPKPVTTDLQKRDKPGRSACPDCGGFSADHDCDCNFDGDGIVMEEMMIEEIVITVIVV